MQIERLIPFKSSTDQAMNFLYFLRIRSSFCSFSSIKLASMITSFDFFFLILKRHISDLRIILSKLAPHNFFLLLVPSLHCYFDFSVLP